jgi:hypothetical protein
MTMTTIGTVVVVGRDDGDAIVAGNIHGGKYLDHHPTRTYLSHNLLRKIHKISPNFPKRISSNFLQLIYF